MANYIDRQVAIDAVSGGMCSGWDCDVIDKLKALPSVQPEIIRCKDCKWWEKLHSRCDLFQMYQTEEWYCANAELREEQHD